MKIVVRHTQRQQEPLLNYYSDLCPRVGEHIGTDKGVYLVGHVSHVVEKKAGWDARQSGVLVIVTEAYV